MLKHITIMKYLKTLRKTEKLHGNTHRKLYVNLEIKGKRWTRYNKMIVDSNIITDPKDICDPFN